MSAPGSLMISTPGSRLLACLETMSETNEIAMSTGENHHSVHRFILQAIDPLLGCPVLEAMLRVADLDTLRPLLGEDVLDDVELRGSYELNSPQLQAITDRFDVAFDPD